MQSNAISHWVDVVDENLSVVAAEQSIFGGEWGKGGGGA